MNYNEYKQENALAEEDRVLTKTEEQVIRLCHHDFAGKTQSQAARMLGVSLRSVSHAINRVKLKAPQLFPILSPRENEAKQYVDQGATNAQLAILMEMSPRRVTAIIRQLKRKGVNMSGPTGVVAYKPSMDKNIKEKF